MKTNENTITRKTIGFRPSYMTDVDDTIKTTTEPQEIVGEYEDLTLHDVKVKIVQMTRELMSKRFARLSKKTKLAKVLDYNMLIQVEIKLSNRS